MHMVFCKFRTRLHPFNMAAIWPLMTLHCLFGCHSLEFVPLMTLHCLFGCHLRAHSLEFVPLFFLNMLQPHIASIPDILLY